MSFVGKDISRTIEIAPTLNKTRPMKSLTRHWTCTGKLIQLRYRNHSGLIENFSLTSLCVFAFIVC